MSSSTTAESEIKAAILASRDATRLKEARAHALKALTLAPTEWNRLQELGILLFELGLLSAAKTTLESASRAEALNHEATEIIIALYQKEGDQSASRRYMKSLAGIIKPQESSAEMEGKPGILTIEAFEKRSFHIALTGASHRARIQRNGGHWSDRHLIDPDQFQIYRAGVCSDVPPPSLDELKGIRVVINKMGCPDFDPQGLDIIERTLSLFPTVPIINHPVEIRQLSRSGNSRRLSTLPGVRIAKTETIILSGHTVEDTEPVIIPAIAYPAIVRLKGTHTGVSMKLLQTPDELAAWLSGKSKDAEINICPYIEYQDSDGHYIKYRCFFIDKKFYPVARVASDHWNVHSRDRYRIMHSSTRHQAEEYAYLRDPEGYLGAKAYGTLMEVCNLLDLDFVGIDYTLAQDGSVIIFEANAAMRHNFDHAENFPYTRPFLDNVSRGFTELLKTRIALS